MLENHGYILSYLQWLVDVNGIKWGFEPTIWYQGDMIEYIYSDMLRHHFSTLPVYE